MVEHGDISPMVALFTLGGRLFGGGEATIRMLPPRWGGGREDRDSAAGEAHFGQLGWEDKGASDVIDLAIRNGTRGGGELAFITVQSNGATSGAIPAGRIS
jgi:hypothetical protein